MTKESFDAAALWSRVDGDLDLLRELVAVFVAELPTTLEQIELGIRRGAGGEVKKASHRIKGSLLQFSARPAAAVAKKLEEMGATDSLAGADAALIEFREELKFLVEALQLSLVKWRDELAIETKRASG